MLGDLPPSSNCAGRINFARASNTFCPVMVPPVNANTSTSGCADSGAPASTPVPDTTLNAPAGTPASSANCAAASNVRLVSSLGFSTTLQPAANAGANFHAPTYNGKFHGVICPTTPAGSRSTMPSVLPGSGIVCPTIFVASPA